MLGFLISTIAFSVVVYAMNRYFKYQEIDQASAHKAIVLVVATVASFGVGWLVDNLDGDAKLPEKHISFVDVIKSGDPMQIALKLIGVN